jgi:hypothetical protein
MHNIDLEETRLLTLHYYIKQETNKYQLIYRTTSNALMLISFIVVSAGLKLEKTSSGAMSLEMFNAEVAVVADGIIPVHIILFPISIVLPFTQEGIELFHDNGVVCIIPPPVAFEASFGL